MARSIFTYFIYMQILGFFVNMRVVCYVLFSTCVIYVIWYLLTIFGAKLINSIKFILFQQGLLNISGEKRPSHDYNYLITFNGKF